MKYFQRGKNSWNITAQAKVESVSLSLSVLLATFQVNLG